MEKDVYLVRVMMNGQELWVDSDSKIESRGARTAFIHSLQTAGLVTPYVTESHVDAGIMREVAERLLPTAVAMVVVGKRITRVYDAVQTETYGQKWVINFGDIGLSGDVK